jgi:RepB DNA-primase from phage plasmid
MIDGDTLLTPVRAPPLAPELCPDVAPPAHTTGDNAASHGAADFIKAVFGPVTESPVWIQSLGNPGSDARPESIATRDPAKVASFVTKWDRDGRGMYFCVSTIDGAKRIKGNAAEIIGLWVDIDCKDIDDTPEDVDRKLAKARCPPSLVNATGNGRHAYWLFKEALIGATDNQARVEAALKLLCDLFGADQAVTQIVALMRLPGTHNTKFGKWIVR